MITALLLLVTAQAPPLDARVEEPVPPTRLVYMPGRYASACPGEVEVQEAVARRLGSSPFGEPAERVVVLALDGDTEVPSRARAELFQLDMESLGVRTLESSEGCVELVEASALAISIALAPGLALAPQPPPEPVPVEPPPVEPPAVGEPEPEEPVVELLRTPPGPTWLPEGAVLVVGGGSSATFGVAPQSVTGIHLTMAARQGDLELRIEQRQHLPSWDGSLGVLHGGSIWSLMPCGHLPLFSIRDATDRFGVMTCGTGSVGSLWALGAYTGGAAYAGLGGRVALEWTQQDLSAIRAWMQVEWSVVRPAFFAINGAPPWEQDLPANAVLGVTWETSWPF